MSKMEIRRELENMLLRPCVHDPRYDEPEDAEEWEDFEEDEIDD